MIEWKEYRIGDFLKRIKRNIPIEAGQEYSLLTIKLYHKGIVPRGEKSGNDIKAKTMFLVHEGDFILSGIDARNGAFGIVPKELEGAVVTNDFWYFEIDDSIIDKKFFLELTKTTWFDDICNKGSDGTTNRIRLQKYKFFNQIISLPPVTEQINLREKLINVRIMIDKLEGEIDVSKKNVSYLRQAILQEAVQGKLTAQWRKENPDVEPTSRLLERIKDEKEQLNTKKKKQVIIPANQIQEQSFTIPSNWSTCRLEELTEILNGRAYKKNELLLDENLIPVLRVGNLFTSNSWYYSDLNLESNKYCEKGDLLYAWSASFGPFIWKGPKVIYHYHIWKLDYSKFLHRDFLYYFLLNETDRIKASGHGVSMIHMTKAKMELLQVALPPLEEQKAIVEKVNSLMDLCDKLEQEVQQSKTLSEKLMQSVLREVFEDKKS